MLSASAGGLVDYGCRVVAGSGRVVSVRAIKVLRFARGSSIEGFAGLRVDGELAHELQAALGEVVRYVLDRELNSGKFVAQVTALESRHARDRDSPYNQESKTGSS
jgi:hypothetical protein